MKQALPPLSARSLWANSRAAFPVHLTGASGFHMDAIGVNQDSKSENDNCLPLPGARNVSKER
jgi:hypothetical protein